MKKGADSETSYAFSIRICFIIPCAHKKLITIPIRCNAAFVTTVHAHAGAVVRKVSLRKGQRCKRWWYARSSFLCWML